MSRDDVEWAEGLKGELLALFDRYGADVAVGLRPGGGVVIRSQDPFVDASNMGIVTPQADAAR